MACANLALGRPSAAIRVLSVAEHAYGARRSAWRKAALLLATCSRGASAPNPRPQPPPISGGAHGGGGLGSDTGGTNDHPNGGVYRDSGAYGADGVGGSVGSGGGCGGGGWGFGGAEDVIGDGRDPALSMCRFLRGLGLLAGGDPGAAAEQMEVRSREEKAVWIDEIHGSCVNW